MFMEGRLLMKNSKFNKLNAKYRVVATKYHELDYRTEFYKMLDQCGGDVNYSKSLIFLNTSFDSTEI